MRILHTVEFYEPSKGGAQEVVRQLSERLAARGHEVTVATSFHPERTVSRLNGVDIRSFNIRGNAVKGIFGESKAYVRFLVDSRFDVILNYAAQTWATDLTFTALNRLEGKKVLSPLGFSRLYDKKYKKYFTDLPGYMRQYDRLVYTSANYQDKYFGDQNGLAGKAAIIPNGASGEEFDRPPLGFREKFGIRTKYLFLSVSNHYFEKGHRIVIEAFQKAGISDATLVIIGDRPSRHSWYSCSPLCTLSTFLNSGVKVFSDVPRPWVVSAFQEADLFLSGSKVECAPLVMYECFASLTPFVTAPAGNVADHRDFVTIVNTKDEMAERIRLFVGNPAEFAERSRAARTAFEKDFSWSQIAAQFERLYESL